MRLVHVKDNIPLIAFEIGIPLKMISKVDKEVVSKIFLQLPKL